MRSARSGLFAFATVLLACGPQRDGDGELLGERFWLVGGGLCGPCELWEMGRADGHIALHAYLDHHADAPVETIEHAIGTLTADGLAAWDAAVASVDPA